MTSMPVRGCFVLFGCKLCIERSPQASEPSCSAFRKTSFRNFCHCLTALFKQSQSRCVQYCLKFVQTKTYLLSAIKLCSASRPFSSTYIILSTSFAHIKSDCRFYLNLFDCFHKSYPFCITILCFTEGQRDPTSNA